MALRSATQLGRGGGPFGDPGLLPDPLVVDEPGGLTANGALPVHLAVVGGEVGEAVLLGALLLGAQRGEEPRVVALLDDGRDQQDITVVPRRSSGS